MTPIFEDVFRQMLIDTNLCGNRVYLMRAPQTVTIPYMVFAPTGPEPLHAHSGPLNVLVRHYQVSIFHTSQSLVLSISDSLRMSLDGAQGYYLGVDFGAILFRLQTQFYEQDTQLFESLLEFRISFEIVNLSAATTAVPMAVKSERTTASHGHSVHTSTTSPAVPTSRDATTAAKGTPGTTPAPTSRGHDQSGRSR